MTAAVSVRSSVAQLILLTTVCLALFFNTFSNELVWDDPALIQENPYIRDVRNIPLFFLPGYWNDLHPDPGQYRPLRTASFALDYHFWKLNPAGYHISNVAFHTLNVLLVFWLVTVIRGRRMAATAGKTGRDGLPGLAFLTALFFAAHPIHTESINLVKNRSDLLAFMFMLLSLLLFVKQFGASRRISRFLLTLTGCFFFMAALTAKEMALSLPGVMALYAVSFVPGIRLKKVLALIVPYAVIIAVFFGFKQFCFDNSFINPAGTTLAGAILPADSGQHILAVIKTIGLYFSMLAVPFPLNAEHAFAIPMSMFERPVLLSLALLSLIGAGALRAYRRDRIVLFAAGWILLTLMPVVNIIYLGTRPVAEQRLYIPSFGFCLLLAYGLTRMTTFWGGHLKPIRARLMIGLLAGGIFWLYAIITVTRNFDWRNEVVFYSRSLIFNPGSVRMHYNLGMALNKAGYYEAAINHYRQALIFHPDYPEAHNNLGVAYYWTGRYKKAIAHYQAALRLKPDSFDLRVNLGLAFYKAGFYQAAERYLQRALRMNPFDVKANIILGDVLAAMGRLDAAAGRLAVARRLRPDWPEVNFKLGNIYLQQGRPDKAVYYYQKTLAVVPDNIDAIYNTGLALMAGREYAEAFKSFSRVLEINPDHEKAKDMRARCREMAETDKSAGNGPDVP